MNTDKKATTVQSGPVPDFDIGQHEPHNASFWTKFVSHIWDSDQRLKSPQERALVRKLDFGILICATLGWVSSSRCLDTVLMRPDSFSSGSSVSMERDVQSFRSANIDLADIDQSNLTNACKDFLKGLLRMLWSY